MKTDVLPAVRVEPALREQLQQVLAAGETMSAFVEASVRDSVRRRVEQARFMERGLASLAAARISGEYVDADDAVAKLEARLAAVRLAGRRKPAAAG